MDVYNVAVIKSTIEAYLYFLHFSYCLLCQNIILFKIAPAFILLRPLRIRLSYCSIRARVRLSYCSVRARVRLSYCSVRARVRLSYCSVRARVRLSYCSVRARARLSYCSVRARVRLSYCSVRVRVRLSYCSVRARVRLSYCSECNFFRRQPPGNYNNMGGIKSLLKKCACVGGTQRDTLRR